MPNSRAKGCRGERLIAADVALHLGVRCVRMGRNGRTAEDLDHDLAGAWIECKRPARCAAFRYLHQAERDCGGKVPIVVIRPDREESAVLVRLADLPELARRVVAATDSAGSGAER